MPSIVWMGCARPGCRRLEHRLPSSPQGSKSLRVSEWSASFHGLRVRRQKVHLSRRTSAASRPRRAVPVQNVLLRRQRVLQNLGIYEIRRVVRGRGIGTASRRKGGVFRAPPVQQARQTIVAFEAARLGIKPVLLIALRRHRAQLLSFDLLYACVLDDTRPKGHLTFDYFGEFRRSIREGRVS